MPIVSQSTRHFNVVGAAFTTAGLAAATGRALAATAAGVMPYVDGPTDTGFYNSPTYPGGATDKAGAALIDGSAIQVQSGQTYSNYLNLGGGDVGFQASPVNNVTFNNCVWENAGASSPNLLIRSNGPLTFNYCTVRPAGLTNNVGSVTQSQGYQYGILADGTLAAPGTYNTYQSGTGTLTFYRCDVWGYANATKCAESNSSRPLVFDHCWVHNSRENTSGDDHTDGIGCPGGGTASHVTITGCRLDDDGDTNGLAYQSADGSYWSNFTITNNLFGGYGYTIRITSQSGATLGGGDHITFTDNTFSTALRPAFAPLYDTSFATSAGSLWRRNRWLVPSGAAWGNPANSGKYWIPSGSAISGSDDSPFVSDTDFTGGTPDGPPNTPTIGTATAGDTAASVAFTPSGSGSTATSYRAISTPGSITATNTASPISVTGLTNATAYTFTVRAQNSAGNSAESSASNSVTPVAASSPPNTPTIGTATAGNASASVAFTPSGSGAAATSYRAISSPSGITATATSSPISVSGLTNGTAYTFTVRAQNAAGNSAESSASNSATPAAPSTLASDTFTRANQTGLGTASTGGTWTEATGSPWQIVSNQAVAVTSAGDWRPAWLSSLSANVRVQVDFLYTGSIDLGPVARVTDADNLIFLDLGTGGAGELIGNIFRRSSGSFTALGTLFTVTGLTTSTVHTARLDCSGSAITAFIDGVQVCSGTDSTQSGTGAGIARLGGGDFSVFDNFTVTSL